jgi:4'-phosphopantetheinyl transferase
VREHKLGGREARLWLLDLGAEPPAEELDWLSAEERTQASRFAFAPDRRRFLAAHVALRRLLGQVLELAPAALVFERDALGKPRLATVGCDFNLSHSGNAAAVAIGSRPIGVDIEQLRQIDDLEALAERCFTANEQRELGSVGERRAEWFLQGWTRKESCLKAIGCGLSLEPATFETGLAADTAAVQLNWNGRPHRLRVQSFRDGATIGAIATELPAQSRD